MASDAYVDSYGERFAAPRGPASEAYTKQKVVYCLLADHSKIREKTNTKNRK